MCASKYIQIYFRKFFFFTTQRSNRPKTATSNCTILHLWLCMENDSAELLGFHNCRSCVAIPSTGFVPNFVSYVTRTGRRVRSLLQANRTGRRVSSFFQAYNVPYDTRTGRRVSSFLQTNKLTETDSETDSEANDYETFKGSDST
jgi:hypothetical protein